VNLLKKEKLWWSASLGALVGMVNATFILPGWDDLYLYYQPFAQDYTDCGYVPYFAQWFL
jgi:hypothetical protein